MTDHWKVEQGDCRDIMRTLPDNSVDAIVSDPPYGLEFMGKEWDAPWKARGESPNGAGFTTGGFASGNGYANRKTPSYGKPWMNKRCTVCGHTQSGGSPCRCDNPQWVIERGATNQQMVGFQAWATAWATEALRVAKPGAHLVAFGGTRTYHRLAVAIEDAGWEVRDCLSWLYGQGFPKSHNLDGEHTGWGTALKPAWEPIILARKPLSGTVAANVTQYGTGAINVDGCRIGTDAVVVNNYRNGGDCTSWSGSHAGQSYEQKIQQGRWPANVCLDGDAAALLDAQSGTIKTSRIEKPSYCEENGNWGTLQGRRGARGYSDTGGASRFFYTAKVSRREREAGLDGMPERIAKRYGEQGQGPTPQQTPREHKAAANHHPTVKPIALMRWLCRLVTPPGGLILDPFNGSGSTGCAAVLEGFRYIGCELEAEYVEIARRRIAYWEGQRAEPDLFG